ncbi:MAG: hypothetical protein ABEK29_07100 [Bradymonadaceae bacterium]
MAETKLEEIEVELTPETTSPGEAVECRIGLDPNNDVSLNGITARLRRREFAIDRRQGNDTRRRIHDEVYEETEVPEASGVTLMAGESAEYQTTLTVRETGAYSFESDDNKIRWQVVVTIDVEGWPDWERTPTFMVRPPAAPSGR